MSTRVEKVLVVEDNQVDREWVMRLLDDGGRAIVAADSAATGLEVYDRDRPDCVLLDYRLPDADGFSALEALVEREATVIILTGVGDERVAVEAMQRGAANYLVKDKLDTKGLVHAIQRAVEQNELREYNNALLAAIPDTIYRIRRDGTVVEYLPGEAAAPIDGTSLVGRRLSECPFGEIAGAYEHAVHQALEKPGVVSLDYDFELKDGERRWHEARARACGDEEVVITVRDVTRHRRMERQMQVGRRLESLGRLASGVAHDFNNLLTLIQSYACFVQRSFDKDRNEWSDLQEIIDATERASRLTNQLLAFSRRQPQELRTIDLNAVLTETRKMLNRLIGEDIEISTRLCSTPAVIHGDLSRLEQVVLNLAINARDAMPRGGRLTIETSVVAVEDGEDVDAIATAPGPMPEGRYVVLTVADTGVGMDRSTAQRIFEPFFTTKSGRQGTGLGLSTVYGIVSQHGGGIAVNSTLGKGTTFRVYLPYNDAATTWARDESRSAEVVEGGERVLVVEDDAKLRDSLSRLLTGFGFEVMTASNGTEAMALVRGLEVPLDVVITDLVLPSASGREVAKDVRRIHPDAAVVFMSGYPDEKIEAQGVQRSDESFVQKPFRPRQLLRAIQRALEAQDE